jgi:hypothetical protein
VAAGRPDRARPGAPAPGPRSLRTSLKGAPVPPAPHSGAARARTPTAVATGLLAVAALSLLVPKLLLASFYGRLWIQLSAAELVAVLVQDAAVAVAVFAAASACLRTRSRAAHLLCAAASLVLLAVLLLDARVREMWLRPTDFALMSYGWSNRSDLRSGLDLFFNHGAGWGMTFRRALVVLLAAHALVWVALLGLARRRGSDPAPAVPGRWWRAALAPVAVLALVAASPAGGRHRYRMHENILVNPIAAVLRPARHGAKGTGRAFEQPPRPLAAALATPRLVLKDVPRFRNVVIVFLESVRWRDAGAEDDSSPHPTLRRLAREGLVARCYAPIPHSSKGYYAVLTGRYPYPGIEMRESMKFSRPSFIRGLRERAGVRTYAFTSMHFGFENTGGLLDALGIDTRFELTDLQGAAAPDESTSSFGGGDASLYERAAEQLASRPGRFLAVLMPVAAHYPYAYPGKPATEGATHDAYLKALVWSDEALGILLRRLEERDLLADTLLVLVGDHGESFGEHGALVHNSSLHEEEVTVPLVFWSSDGRLRHRGVLAARQIDVAPTIADLLGLEGDDTPVQGESILRVPALRPAYLSTFFDDLGLAVVEPPRKYLFHPTSDELVEFDLAADPFERAGTAVAGERKAAIVERLRAFQAHQRNAFED